MPLDTAADQKTFRWDDPLDLASRLSEDERMIWEAARSYAREKLLPRVVSAYAEERFDREIMTEMGALGFLGPTLPEKYGCAEVIDKKVVASQEDRTRLAFRATVEPVYYEGRASYFYQGRF